MKEDRESPFFFHSGIGHRIRKGTWHDHARSTYDLCVEAIDRGRWSDAAELAEYTIVEALEPHELYATWIEQIRDFILEAGVDEDALKADEQALTTRLQWPNGSPFDADRGWQAVRQHVQQAVVGCETHDGALAKRHLEDSRRIWLETHDRKCDWVQGLITIVADRVGEACIGTLWDHLMAPMFDGYERYDTDRTPWSVSAEILLQVTAEALRGHLSGASRRGEIEYVEEPGRRGFRFTPCGSGGRNFTGETLGSYPLTTEEHPWAWNMKGVCLYCAHCCALSERNPIARFGYPARVVEPPFQDGEQTRTHCTWWIYDDPREIPDAVYRRTGNRKPTEIGGEATRRKRQRNAE